jgi:pimeloyl-ACP methyl ester carboxylesterase
VKSLIRTLLLTVLVVALGACRRASSQGVADAAADGPADASASSERVRDLPPLTAESWRIELPVPDFSPAVVSVPLGARTPRPLVIALHGHADRGEWQCGTWTGITSARAFVLCPQGRKLPGGADARYTYAGATETERELRAALKALKSRFREHLAAGPVILAGYSLGASHAARIARQEPSYFSRVVLVEGAYGGQWSAGDAAVFAKGGGQKLMMVCAQTACAHGAERAVLFTKRARADAELVFPGQLGHVFDGRVASAIKARLPWLVEGDERWRPNQAVTQ